mgnify:CR=1 FL=1
MTSRRKKAIIRRRIFIALLVAILVAIGALGYLIFKIAQNDPTKNEDSSEIASVSSNVSEPSSEDAPQSSSPSSKEEELSIYLCILVDVLCLLVSVVVLACSASR